MNKRHVVELIVEDQPTVLARVAGLCVRRGVVIETLTAGRDAASGLMRIVLTTTGDDAVLEQMRKQINKLIDVRKISVMEPETSVTRELSFVKMKIRDSEMKEELFKYAEIYNAKVVDLMPESVIFQVVGDIGKIESFIALIEKFGIEEVSRTGITAIRRGNEGTKNE